MLLSNGSSILPSLYENSNKKAPVLPGATCKRFPSIRERLLTTRERLPTTRERLLATRERLPLLVNDYCIIIANFTITLSFFLSSFVVFR